MIAKLFWIVIKISFMLWILSLLTSLIWYLFKFVIYHILLWIYVFFGSVLAITTITILLYAIMFYILFMLYNLIHHLIT